MEYALNMVNNMTAPANDAAASMRELHGELSSAKTELAALEAAQKNLQKGDAVDIEAWKQLNGQIDVAKKKVVGVQTEIAKQGGAAFSVSKYDKKQAEEKAARDKAQSARSEQLSKSAERNTQMLGLAGKAAGLAIAGAMAVGAVAVKGFSFVFEKALAAQAQSQARLNAIHARFNRGLLDIAKNANLKPILNAGDRLAAMFDKSTNTGKFMGEQVRRAFDAIGKAVEVATPYAEKAFARVLIASLDVEIAFWSVVDAAASIGLGLTKALKETPGSLETINQSSKDVKSAFDELDKAATKVGEAFGAVTGNSTAMGFVFSIMAGQVRTVAITLGMVGRVVSGVAEIIGGVGDIISGVFKGDASRAVRGFGEVFEGVFKASSVAVLGPLKIVANAIDAITMGKFDLSGKVNSLEKAADEMAKKAYAPMKEAGKQTKGVGNDIGDGLIKGLDDKQGPIYEAGKKAAEEAIRGAKDGAQVASPSKKMRREVGFMMAAGVALGLGDGASMVYDAAKESLVPEVEVSSSNGSSGGAGNSNGSSGGMGRVTHFHAGAIVIGAGANVAEVERVVRKVIREESDDVVDSMGMEVAA